MGSQQINADILAQVTLLGGAQNTLEDFLADPERGLKLLQSLQAFDPAATGFRNEDIFAAAQGLARITEALLVHLLEKHKGNERIKNLVPAAQLLVQLRSGPITDRRALNRIIGTFYLDWPYAAHWRRDLYRVPAGGLSVMNLVFGGMQKLRDLLDEQTGLA